MTNKPEFETIDQVVAKTVQIGEHLIIAAPCNEPSGYKSGLRRHNPSNELVGRIVADDATFGIHAVSGGDGKSVNKFELAGVSGVNQNKRAGIGSAAKRKKPKPISKNTLSLINRVIRTGATT